MITRDSPGKTRDRRLAQAQEGKGYDVYQGRRADQAAHGTKKGVICSVERFCAIDVCTVHIAGDCACSSSNALMDRSLTCNGIPRRRCLQKVKTQPLRTNRPAAHVTSDNAVPPDPMRRGLETKLQASPTGSQI